MNTTSNQATTVNTQHLMAKMHKADATATAFLSAVPHFFSESGSGGKNVTAAAMKVDGQQIVVLLTKNSASFDHEIIDGIKKFLNGVEANDQALADLKQAAWKGCNLWFIKAFEIVREKRTLILAISNKMKVPARDTRICPRSIGHRVKKVTRKARTSRSQDEEVSVRFCRKLDAISQLVGLHLLAEQQLEHVFNVSREARKVRRLYELNELKYGTIVDPEMVKLKRNLRVLATLSAATDAIRAFKKSTWFRGRRKLSVEAMETAPDMREVDLHCEMQVLYHFYLDRQASQDTRYLDYIGCSKLPCPCCKKAVNLTPFEMETNHENEYIWKLPERMWQIDVFHAHRKIQTESCFENKGEVETSFVHEVERGARTEV